MIEAVERLANGRETKRLLELFTVSSLGLAVMIAIIGGSDTGEEA